MRKKTWGGKRPGAGRPRTVAVAEPVGRRRLLHERPELWQFEENRLKEEHRYFVYCLRYGPNAQNLATDDELRAVYDAWGREAGDWDQAERETGVWGEWTYAHLRFVAGLSVEDALAAVRRHL